MPEEENSAPSNAHLDEPSDADAAEETDEGGIRPSGGASAANAGAVGQHPDKMRERGTLDPDKPDPSGGAPG